MIVLEWVLYIFSWLFFVCGFFIVFSCFIGMMKYKDFFIRVHAVKISNIYGISAMLFSFGLNSENLLVFLQLMIIVILNILITITISHAICRIAINNNIVHGGFSRKKYNELLSEKEKKEANERLQERIKIQEEMSKKPPSAS